MSHLNTETFPVRTYLKMFFRHKEIVIVLIAVGLTLGICTSLVLPMQFRSSTVILVEEGKTDNPLFEKLAVSTTVRERLTNIRESMLGWYSLVELVKRLGLDKNISNQKGYENLILGIRRRIDIEMKGTNILQLAYVGDDPIITQAVVQNITDIFVDRNKEIQSQETSDAIVFIEEQLKVYKGKIKSAEIADLQDELDELLVDSTEKHPLVRQFRERIERKKEELRKENLEFTEAAKIKSETNKGLIDSIESALNTLGADTGADREGLYKMMLIDKLGDVVARDAKVNEEIYNVLLERLETAKITQRLQTSKEGTKYTILDPPRVPLAPFKPNRLLVSLGGLLAGLAVGVGIVFFVEFFDKSFIDVQDAKEFLGVPLLGAISKITTIEEVHREKARVLWLYMVTGLACSITVLSVLTMVNVFK
ncbi:MAG: GNVR domain-containing protein [Candidatus Omnitrophota bacterium]